MIKSDKQVVVALDGSGNSLRALQTGANLADAMGRELALLFVYPYGERGKRPAELSSVTEASFEEHQASLSESVFSAAEAELGSRRQAVKRYLLAGDPASEIISFLEARPGVHLVMGRRGLSKLKSLLMGSVSDKVTRHASGLVTVVG